MGAGQTGSCCVPVFASKRGDTESGPLSRKEPYPQKHAATGITGNRNTVKIPGGSALVGTNNPVIKIDGEYPLRKVRIKPFLIDSTTVTNQQFLEFVNATGYVTEAEKIGSSFVFEGQLPHDAEPSQAVVGATWWRLIEGANWRSVSGPQSVDKFELDHPVVHVTWNDAVAYADWVGGRLPTEAEWEHAARGGLGDSRFPWGEREPNDTDFFPCNIWQGRFPQTNLALDGYAATAPAKSFHPNNFGLYNVIGNVWEWTSAAFKVKSLSKAIQKFHAGKADFKLSKGGSFLCHSSYCFRYRIAARTGSSPDSSMSNQGFRIVYDEAV